VVEVAGLPAVRRREGPGLGDDAHGGLRQL
jgi:hypothetical protein